MAITTTSIPGLLLFDPKVFKDERGYFYESFHQKIWEEQGITRPFVQDNQAKSTKGVLRGLHYQAGPYAQAKLVRVISGEVLDVVVDLREGSPSYGQSYSVKLSAKNKRQMYVPRGFAHGYLVLSKTAQFFYKCDNFYSKAHEGGLLYSDPTLKIDWAGFDISTVLVSAKDMVLPTLGQHIPVEVPFK